MSDTMRQAMRLMQGGDLRAATRAIQAGLADAPAPCAPTPSANDVVDGEFRVVDDAGAPSAGNVRVSPRPARDARATNTLLRFTCSAGSLDYALHVPPGRDTTGASLLVMLHGCTQTPDDFARGTRMSTLAHEHGYVVAYPAQSVERNPNRCWNWFRGSDQQRDRGEPAILAALTRALVAGHRLDARRVYAAGLSAGGAMAAVLADTHPDVYAAIGVHSGLPTGLASDMRTAFAAMRNPAPAARPANASSSAIPAIVFHGDVDGTVHPGNGDAVIGQALGGPAHHATVERGTAPGGRRYTRTVHTTPDGRVAAEHWVVHGTAHAWSGGDPSGSYTDPAGPDASAQMLRFFSACARRA